MSESEQQHEEARDSEELVVRRYYEEVWNQERRDTLDSLATPELAEHLGKAVFWWRQGFSDLRVNVLEVFRADNRIVARVVMTGRHTRTFKLGEREFPATGREIRLRDTEIFSFTDGKLSAVEDSSDPAAVAHQIAVQQPGRAVSRVLSWAARGGWLLVAGVAGGAALTAVFDWDGSAPGTAQGTAYLRCSDALERRMSFEATLMSAPPAGSQAGLSDEVRESREQARAYAKAELPDALAEIDEYCE